MWCGWRRIFSPPGPSPKIPPEGGGSQEATAGTPNWGGTPSPPGPCLRRTPGRARDASSLVQPDDSCKSHEDAVVRVLSGKPSGDVGTAPPGDVSWHGRVTDPALQVEALVSA